MLPEMVEHASGSGKQAGERILHFYLRWLWKGLYCLWKYVGVYANECISGTSTRKRSEFQRLIADCESGKIDIILTKSISRFAGNTVDLLNTVRHLKELGISVRFEKDHIRCLKGNIIAYMAKI